MGVWNIFIAVLFSFFRHLLPITKSTPRFMIYGELGRKSLKLIINQGIISFCVG